MWYYYSYFLTKGAGRGPPGKMASEDNSVILVNLNRPIFFVQPTAFDKGKNS